MFKQIIIESLLLILLALAVGLVVNAVRSEPLPLMEDFRAAQASRSIAQGQAISLDEALRLNMDQAALFVDARTAMEYSFGHIPGAVSLPLEEFQAGAPLLRQLHQADLVVCYCGDTLCPKAEKLAELLRQEGIHAVFFAEGLDGWLVSGGQLEVN